MTFLFFGLGLWSAASVLQLMDACVGGGGDYNEKDAVGLLQYLHGSCTKRTRLPH